MIKIGNKIIDALESGRMIEIVSLPDSGTSSAMLALTKAMPAAQFLIVDFVNMTKPIGYIEKLVDKNTIFLMLEPDECHTSLVKNIEPFLKTRLIDYVIVDNFASYVLHREKKTIKRLLSDLNGLSDVYGSSIVVVNQLRHDMNHLDKNGYAPLVPLYRNYIGPMTDTQIIVSREKTDIRFDILKSNVDDIDDLFDF